MRVVRDDEDSVSENGYAAIRAFCGITARLARAGALVVPDGAPCARIEGEYLIRTGDIHHTIDDDRSYLEHLMIDRKNPFELQFADVGRIDFI